MSNVTSQSELTTKEIVEQAISDYHESILPYLNGMPALNYSLEEQKIGTDTNGKPVYQKTFKYPSTITISGNTTISDFIDVASLHIDKIKTIIGNCNYNSSNGPVFTLPLANEKISQTSGIYFDNSTNKLVFEGYRGDNGTTNLYNVEVTATYTKTTD